MKTLIILAHPNLANSRINKVLVQSIENEPSITVRDLYQLYPDFKIDTQKELEFLKTHDKLIYQFPLYNYGSPALLKEYQDAIFIAASSSDIATISLEIFANKVFGIFTSAGGPKEAYKTEGRYKKDIDDILVPFYLGAEYVKMKHKPAFCTYNVSQITDEEIKLATQDYKNAIKNL